MSPPIAPSFLSIHQIADAANVCDRFVLLSGGRVVAEGTLEVLMALAHQRAGHDLPPDFEEVSLPSRNNAWKWLLQKEWRELMSSRSWWVMLALIGPLVGVSFISAVRSYAEASGRG